MVEPPPGLRGLIGTPVYSLLLPRVQPCSGVNDAAHRRAPTYAEQTKA